MGGWAIAQSPILVTTITLDRLKKRGYEALLTYYQKVALHLNEPSRLRRDGERGASVGLMAPLYLLDLGAVFFNYFINNY